MLKWLRRLRRNEKGNVLIILAACMPLLVGAAGLATDTIQWSLWKRQLQRAADSAAIAGVYERNVAEGGTVRVLEVIQRDLALNQHAGTLSEVPILSYPANVPGTGSVSRKNQVSVTLRTKKSLAFSSFFLSSPPVIEARSTAASVAGGGEYCVIALDSNKVVGIDVAGNTTVNIGDCCMITNATEPNNAFQNTGDASAVVAGCIAAGGGVKYSKSINWKVGSYNPYSEPAEDPHKDLPTPKITDCTTANVDIPSQQNKYPDGIIDRSVTDAPTGGVPKVICIKGGISVPTSSTLKLGAATYVLDGGDLTMNATSAKISCNGCTIILTNFADRAKTGNFRMTGGTLDLTAPTTGTYKDIALYQDRAASDDGKRKANAVNGNNNGGVVGAIYTPARSLLYNGGGNLTATCMKLIAKRLDFSGNSNIKLSSLCGFDTPAGDTGRLIRLVA